MLLVLAFTVAAMRRARAFDALESHPALTQAAALRSTLHRTLVVDFGLPLGLFSPLRIPAAARSNHGGRDPALRGLAELPPVCGCVPDEQGIQTALGWLAAGSVLEELPSERGLDHFLDPRTDKGLSISPAMGRDHGWTRWLGDPTGSRGATHRSALERALQPQGPLSLGELSHQLGLAATAATPAQRHEALARALLAAGALLHVLQDMAVPAHVHDDLRTSYGQPGAPLVQTPDGMAANRPVDPASHRHGPRGSRFEQLVRDRGLVHAAAWEDTELAPVVRPSVEAFFHASDGLGLADLTAAQLYSEGSVPTAAGGSRPTTGGLAPVRGTELADNPSGGYVRAPDGRRLLAYTRSAAGEVRYYLDDRILLANARTTLRRALAYGAGLLDHLTRGSLQRAGELPTAWRLAGVALREGRVSVVRETTDGRRATVWSRPLERPVLAGQPVLHGAPSPSPGQRWYAVVTGLTATGEPVSIVTALSR
jgi:hypothetical protein